MDATYAQTPAELVFPPQAPFSWTRRWAQRRLMEPKMEQRTMRIAGSAWSSEELSAAIAFAHAHDAKLVLD